MYEDSNNQCTSKFDIAYDRFRNLSSEGRASFMTSDDYVISTARERFEAWARHEGKTISYVDGDYVVVTNGSYVLSLFNTNGTSHITLVIILISVIGLASVGGYYFIRKRKEE